jgi:hypothetical protein
MIKLFQRLFGKKGAKESNRFYQFVNDASSGEKVKILKQVIRKADEDQKDLVKRYEQRYGVTHKGVAN